MRKILAGLALVFVAILATWAVTGAKVEYTGRWNPVPNDGWVSRDTVASTADYSAIGSWGDTLVPDGKWMYEWTIEAAEDADVSGVWYRYSCVGGNATTEWSLCREGTAHTWYVQTDTIFVRGAGTADTTGVCRYEVRVAQDKF